jgi:type II secretory pathway pseudopilin PulG
MTRSDRRRRSEGFSLLELLLACSLGLTLAMAALTALFGDGDLGRRLGRQLREGQRLERALSLIAGDLQRGTVLALDPAAAGLVPACGLAGRRPVLQILGSDGRLTTYSVGTPPDAIWRGWVLMRCGRAFGADGQPNLSAAFQNRVVLDGLDPAPPQAFVCPLPAGQVLVGTGALPLAACAEADSGLVELRLLLRLGSSRERPQRLQGDRSVQLGDQSGMS